MLFLVSYLSLDLIILESVFKGYEALCEFLMDFNQLIKIYF